MRSGLKRMAYSGENYSQDDVNKFTEQFAPWAKAHTIHLENVYGASNNPANPVRFFPPVFTSCSEIMRMAIDKMGFVLGYI